MLTFLEETNANKQTVSYFFMSFYMFLLVLTYMLRPKLFSKFSCNNHSFHLKQCFSGQEKVNEWPLKMNFKCFCIYDFEYINDLSKIYRTDSAVYWSSSVTYCHILHHFFFKTSCCKRKKELLFSLLFVTSTQISD